MVRVWQPDRADTLAINAGGTGTIVLDEGTTTTEYYSLGAARILGPYTVDRTARIYLTRGTLTYDVGDGNSDGGGTPTSGTYDDTALRELIAENLNISLAAAASKADAVHVHVQYATNDALEASLDLAQMRGSISEAQAPWVLQRLADLEARTGGQSASASAYSSGLSFTGSGVIASNHTLAFGTWTNTPTLYEYLKLRQGTPVPSTAQFPNPVTTASTSVTVVPVAEDGGKNIAYQVRAQNATGLWSAPQTTASIAIAAPAGALWVESALSSAVDSVIKALACDDTGNSIFEATTYITTTGAGSVTAPSLVGTATATHASSTTTITWTTPTAAVGLTNTLLVCWLSIDSQASGLVFTQPTGFSTPIYVGIGGLDGQKLYVTYGPVNGSGAMTGAALASSYTGSFESPSYKFSNGCFALANVNASAPIEWSATGSTTTHSSSSPVSMPVTPGTIGQASNNTQYDNTFLAYFASADVSGDAQGDQATGFTPPTQLGGFTELQDLNGASHDWTPTTVAYKVLTPAGAVGTPTGTVSISNNATAYVATLVAFRGTPSGGAGDLVATGSVSNRVWSGSFGARSSSIETVDWVMGVDCSANGLQLAISVGSSQFLSPGYTLMVESDGSIKQQVQRYRSLFDTGTAVGTATDPNGAVQIANNGKTMVSLFAGTTKKVATYEGSGFGALAPSPTLAAPIFYTLQTPRSGNAFGINQAGTRLVTVENGRLLFLQRAGALSTWSLLETIDCGAGATSVCCSSDFSTIFVCTTAGVEVYRGGQGAWALQQLLTVSASWTNLGEALCCSGDGNILYCSERSSTNVTAANLASAYAPQKQYRLRRFVNA